MRVFVLTFVFSALHIVIAQAAEPIVVLTYGENGLITDQHRVNIVRTPCGKTRMNLKNTSSGRRPLVNIMSEYYGGSGLTCNLCRLRFYNSTVLPLSEVTQIFFMRENPTYRQ